MPVRLFIAPTSDFEEVYRTAADVWNRTPPSQRNSGFDLYCDRSDMTAYQYTCIVGQGCRAVAIDETGQNRAFWLAPRSSISKTEWRLANSLGLIDATYRGTVKAALTSMTRVPERTLAETEDRVRYVQLVAADLVPWSEVIVVAELPCEATERGEGGFGSTGST